MKQEEGMKRYCAGVFLLMLFLKPDCALGVGGLDGRIESQAVYYPDKEGLFECRNRLLLEKKLKIDDWLVVYLSGRVDGLAADKPERQDQATANIDDAYCQFYFPRAEVKIGYSKVVWGKLDQLAPVDIVNPLDYARLFLTAERKEAKLAVPLLAVSPYFGDTTRCDFILVPWFREGAYDEMNEQSSPFNIINYTLPVFEPRPAKQWENAEYGLKFSGTLGEADCALYYFRGFEDFPLYQTDSGGERINAGYFQTGMCGYDFELVKGRWGIRGEGAVFMDQGFQRRDSVDYARNNSFITGLGADRSFGDNYVNCSLLYRKIAGDEPIREKRDEVTLLTNLERKFSYEKKAVKLFSIYNMAARSMLVKGTFSVNLRENFWCDLSAGVFCGESTDTLSNFEDSDFISVGGRYSF